jgi:hypothetical protein
MCWDTKVRAEGDDGVYAEVIFGEQRERPDCDDEHRMAEAVGDTFRHAFGYTPVKTSVSTYARNPELPDPAKLIAEEDAAAEADREERQFVVGEVANPGVIERFATSAEATAFIEENFDPADVLAGRYYIDGPQED